MRNKSTKPVHCFFALTKRQPPAVPGRVKGLSLSVSSEAGGMVFNTKRCNTQWVEPRLREAGQVMQKTEHSVPFEGLAGNIPFQGLRRPPAVPGRVKGLSLSVSSEAGWYSIPKSCSMQREEPRLWEAGQVCRRQSIQRLLRGLPVICPSGAYAGPGCAGERKRAFIASFK